MKVSRVTHFKIDGLHATTFSLDTPCGALIGAAIGFCLSKSPCLKETDAERFAAMYLDLKQFIQEVCGGKDQALKHLHQLLEHWVFAQFEEGKSPILPHYALAASELLRRLVNGHWDREPEEWELDPLTRYDERPRDVMLLGCFESRFKREFTEQCRRAFVACVPPGVSLRSYDETIFTEGDEFVFAVERCHLSRVFSHYNAVELLDTHSVRGFDIAAEFVLQGAVLVPDRRGSP